VFISCGQRPGEKEIASKIGKLLAERGFSVYVAIDVQTILEINTEIIRELKNSDCYLFVNFRREQIGRETDGKCRGSLFSNQELAIAYALEFKRILIVNQRGILPEGMLDLIGVNTEEFVGFDDCCDVVERAIIRAEWKPDYSRQLRADNLRFSPDMIRYGNLVGHFLYVDIRNDRPDSAALVATAKCSEFALDGRAPQPSPIRSPLKATAFPGFSHTIFPKSHEAFDLLCVGTYSQPDLSSSEPFLTTRSVLAPPASGTLLGLEMMRKEPGVFLNTALDVVGAPRLPISRGVWKFRYEFFAIDFPVLSVWVELTVKRTGTSPALGFSPRK
jgi:hypothetical protein